MTPPTTQKAGAGPWVALAGGIFAVSTGAIFARLAESPAVVTAAYRVGLASLVLVPICLIKAPAALARLTPSDVKRAVLAGLFLALHFATWISSLDYTSVADSVVLVNTSPIWVGVLSPLITRERIGPATKAGIVLSVVGGAIVGAGDLDVHGRALVGDLLALAGGVCMAMYLLLGRRLRRELDLLVYITLCYGSAAAILWCYVLAAGLPVLGFGPTTWASLVAMALVAQLIGHTCYNWALKWFSAGLIAVALLGEPIGASTLAYIFFAESLTPAKFVGCGVILCAICISAAGEKFEN